ncbi:MAG: 5-formyltetrahydrofolate cyclo-ligase [Oceanicaulis sp.]
MRSPLILGRVVLTRWRKKQARVQAARARAAAHAADPAAGARLAEVFPDEIWPPLNTVVAGYRAIRDEIDPAPLLETFFCDQVRIGLPCVMGPGRPLVFRSWTPGDRLVTGAFGVEEPEPSQPEVRPSLVLIPLLAFDRQGRRLGYGAGFYDRTLERLRQAGPVTAVGIGFEAQRMRRVPTDAHDAPLDWIVTEERAHRVG